MLFNFFAMIDFDFSILDSSFHLVYKSALPIILVALIGGLIAGILRAATQIDDKIFSFAGKLFGVLIFSYLLMNSQFSKILEFTRNVWANSIYYF